MRLAYPARVAAEDDRVDEVATEVVRQVAPVRHVEEDDVGTVARREPTDRARATENVCGVHGAGGQRLGRREPELRGGERADERQALAERAPRIEVGRQGDGRPRV